MPQQNTCVLNVMKHIKLTTQEIIIVITRTKTHNNPLNSHKSLATSCKCKVMSSNEYFVFALVYSTDNAMVILLSAVLPLHLYYHHPQKLLVSLKGLTHTLFKYQ